MRAPRWEHALAEVLAAHERRPFAWWHNDCVRFVARCIAAVRGACPLGGIAWPADAGGAGAVLAAHGGLTAYWTRVLGPPRATPLAAQRGDLVLVRQDGRTACAIVTLTGWHVASPGPDGLVRLPLDAAHRAWSV